jgi:hypothetical protein
MANITDTDQGEWFSGNPLTRSFGDCGNVSALLADKSSVFIVVHRNRVCVTDTERRLARWTLNQLLATGVLFEDIDISACVNNDMNANTRATLVLLGKDAEGVHYFAVGVSHLSEKLFVSPGSKREASDAAARGGNEILSLADAKADVRVFQDGRTFLISGASRGEVVLNFCTFFISTYPILSAAFTGHRRPSSGNATVARGKQVRGDIGAPHSACGGQ